eukprot:6380812-Amphidinium_carterae.1
MDLKSWTTRLTRSRRNSVELLVAVVKIESSAATAAQRFFTEMDGQGGTYAAPKQAAHLPRARTGQMPFLSTCLARS